MKATLLSLALSLLYLSRVWMVSGNSEDLQYENHNSSADIRRVGPFLLYAPVSEPSKKRLRLGYLTGSITSPDNPDFYYRKPGQAISGAITLAIDEINKSPHILPDHTLEFIIAETYGQELISIKRTAEMQNYNISAYIGPQETCIHEGRIAAAFNLPMISYFCSNYEVSNKETYPTFARTKPHDSRISMSVVSLLKKYNWRKVVFVYKEQMSGIADTIFKVLQSHGINVTDRQLYEGPYFHEQQITPFGRIVAETYQRTRIYLMLGEYFEFVGLMVSLLLRGLLDTGEYFVVGVDSRQYNPQTPRIHLEGLFQRKPTRDSIQAFKSFLLIAPAPAVYPGYQSFTTVVNYYLEGEPFNFFNPYRGDGKEKILRPEAAYLYDAVWLYARAANRLVSEGGNPANGTAILELIKETTYKSAMGYITRLDANGDAEGNFTLCARQNVGDNWGLYPVGTFSLNKNATGLPFLKLQQPEDIRWVGEGPPVDEPKCGFFGEKCLPGPDYTPQILGGVLGGLGFILIIVAVVMYRNWHYEQELASLLWKIDYKDIVIREHHSCTYSSQPNNRMALNLRASTASLSSQVDVDLRQVFTQVGTHRNAIVAIKRINKRSVDLTRNVRKELKTMRDLRHDNLNGFVGACVDQNNICIITEYCTRGSLQDILANDDVKLDDMFVASLVFDIIKGLTYIHDSILRSHGRFKSSNCVVDSRWVLKITDYGLAEFKSGAESDCDLASHSYYQALLWTAPELLRDPAATPNGTQQGDVFSFAVVLYEMYGRSGPYGEIEASPRDIVQLVMSKDGDVPFRPKLAALGAVPKFVTDCIKDCWAEDPMSRPDMKTIRHKLKPLRKGMKCNIFDNMMGIMERYATNLEEIVEERTDQLREEKKRTEELLHQMLPKSVAEQLKLGKTVEAEAFDNVTIYFSDICDFTKLSSQSTPMQVIDLLNDLYTTFDAILENYDVYKVETIGDAYMVVSGLPKRNGIRHAGEIASMSLHLLSTIKRFKIRHRPSDTLKLRIGIHSGPVVVGVVGSKMPRYCLFGDTVNTSSRMESNGLPLRIHCSEPTKELLDKLTGFQVEERGLISIKGKGQMRTFWVNGEDQERRMARLTPPACTTSTTTTNVDQSVSTSIDLSGSIANSNGAVHSNNPLGDASVQLPRPLLRNGGFNAKRASLPSLRGSQKRGAATSPAAAAAAAAGCVDFPALRPGSADVIVLNGHVSMRDHVGEGGGALYGRTNEPSKDYGSNAAAGRRKSADLSWPQFLQPNLSNNRLLEAQRVSIDDECLGSPSATLTGTATAQPAVTSPAHVLTSSSAPVGGNFLGSHGASGGRQGQLPATPFDNHIVSVDVDDEDDWHCHPAVSPDSGRCPEESPLLRFSSLRERPHGGAPRLGQRRSLSGETTV